MRRHSYTYVKSFIEGRGFELLSEDYVNNTQKMLVRCEKGHTWKIAFSKAVSGRGCPKCADMKMADERRLSYEFVKSWISSRGGELLSKGYSGNKQLLTVKCEKGHVWHARFNNIKDMGRWCHVCSGTKKLILQDAIDVATERGGECLSTRYINATFSKLKWKCSCGNIWDATLNNVKIGGKWCPMCSSGKSQRQLFNILKQIFDEEKYWFFYNYKGFDWLKTKGNISQEIDIFIKGKVDDFSLAIEYDGEQHFRPIDFFGGIERFKYIKKLDEIKTIKMRENKKDVKHFMRIPFWEKLSRSRVANILVSGGVKI